MRDRQVLGAALVHANREVVVPEQRHLLLQREEPVHALPDPVGALRHQVVAQVEDLAVRQHTRAVGRQRRGVGGEQDVDHAIDTDLHHRVELFRGDAEAGTAHQVRGLLAVPGVTDARPPRFEVGVTKRTNDGLGAC